MREFYVVPCKEGLELRGISGEITIPIAIFGQYQILCHYRNQLINGEDPEHGLNILSGDEENVLIAKGRRYDLYQQIKMVGVGHGTAALRYGIKKLFNDFNIKIPKENIEQYMRDYVITHLERCDYTEWYLQYKQPYLPVIFKDTMEKFNTSLQDIAKQNFLGLTKGE